MFTNHTGYDKAVQHVVESKEFDLNERVQVIKKYAKYDRQTAGNSPRKITAEVVKVHERAKL